MADDGSYVQVGDVQEWRWHKGKAPKQDVPKGEFDPRDEPPAEPKPKPEPTSAAKKP